MNKLSFLETVNVLCDFLEVAVHMILYVRELYPAHLFERRKKYNVPIHVARHPELIHYVRDMICACRPDLEKGTVERICLVVVDKNYAPVERFVFDIQTLVDPKAGNDQTTQDTAMTAEDIEVYLRAFLRKISVCDSVLRPNPPECTFALVLQLRDGTPTAIKHGFPWVPDDQSSDGTIVGQPSSTHIPLKTMNTGLVKVHFFVEETSFKETPVATSG